MWEKTGGSRYETTGIEIFFTGHYTKGNNTFSADAACMLTEINGDRRTSRFCQPQNDFFNL